MIAIDVDSSTALGNAEEFSTSSVGEAVSGGELGAVLRPDASVNMMDGFSVKKLKGRR